MENNLKKYVVEVLSGQGSRTKIIEAHHYTEQNSRIWFYDCPFEERVITSYPAHCTIVYDSQFFK
jgi:hypothetical protein